MPLLTNSLSLWEIAFRWAGKDPDRTWLRLPLEVRDYFRTLMEEIVDCHLECVNLNMEKWQPENGKDMQPFYIRYHWTEVEECMRGVRYDRELMRWARIERWAFMRWCERQGVPLPEFWFPQGWNLEHEWPKESGEEGDAAAPPADRLRPYQRRRIACQVIAEALWKEKPEMTIAAMVRDPLIRSYGGAAYQEEDVVRRWLSEVAPPEVKARIGRPRKKKVTAAKPNVKA